MSDAQNSVVVVAPPSPYAAVRAGRRFTSRCLPHSNRLPLLFIFFLFQVRKPPELGRAGHDPVRVGQRMAVLGQNGPIPGQLRTGRHRQPEGRGPADGRRPDGAGHHAGRPPEENYEQHTGHAGAVFGQPVRGLSGLIETLVQHNRALCVVGPR